MHDTPPLPATAEPMWYAAGPETIAARGGPRAKALADACRARWGGDFAIDLQIVRLGAGACAAPPVKRPLMGPAGGDDEVALLIDAPRPILDGVPYHPPGGPPLFLAGDTPVRGRPMPDAEPGAAPTEALMAIARRGGPRFDRRRRSARCFNRGNRITPRGVEMPPWADDRSLVFHSGFRVIGRLPAFTAAQIGREPVPDLCHPRWLAEHGGPIARAFVAALPRDWLDHPDAVVVGRINELSPGWSSCLAGWHFDGTSRIRKRPDGCPDLANPGVRIQNIACSVGPTAMTGFLVGEVAIPDIPFGIPRGEVRPHQQRIIADLLDAGGVTEVHARPQEVVLMEHGDFHDCRPSARPGWRYFIKAMRNRKDPVHNRFHERGQVTWPVRAETWPDDPLGVFPTALPPGVGPDLPPG